jgi:hypothetical protein
MYGAALMGLLSEEELEVRTVMKSFYSILNHKNFDDIRTLWLPDSEVQLYLPGYDRVVCHSLVSIADYSLFSQQGHFDVEKGYRRMVKESKPMGSISVEIVSVDVHGFFALVQSVETVLPGNELKLSRKRSGPPPKPGKV